MRRIAELFAEPTKKLVPFITAGFPSLDSTAELVLAAEQAGADMVEIGMPFSDPLADGPVIQEASQIALDNGITVKTIIRQVEAVRKKSSVPLVLMGYINPIMRYGLDQFLSDVESAGVDGLILPDLPPEEGFDIYKKVKSHSLSPILLVAPNTFEPRIRWIGTMAEDLMYAVSILGVTGSTISANTKLKEYLGQIRENTDTPFVVGFGISSKEDVAAVAPLADGVVVGSALLKKIKSADDPVATTREFIEELKEGLLDKKGIKVSGRKIPESRSSTGSE